MASAGLEPVTCCSIVQRLIIKIITITTIIIVLMKIMYARKSKFNWTTLHNWQCYIRRAWGKGHVLACLAVSVALRSGLRSRLRSVVCGFRWCWYNLIVFFSIFCAVCVKLPVTVTVDCVFLQLYFVLFVVKCLWVVAGIECSVVK